MSDAGEEAEISACGARNPSQARGSAPPDLTGEDSRFPPVTILLQVFLADEIMTVLGFTATGELASRHRDLRFLQVRMFMLQLFK